MEKRKVTINMPNVGKAEFTRLSDSLKRHLRRALRAGSPTFSVAGQPKATLQLAVKPTHAKTALTEISVWRATKPHVELLVNGKLHKIARVASTVKPLKTAGTKQVPRRLPDTDFVDELTEGPPPLRIPDTEFVLEDAPDSPTRLPDDHFVEEDFED
jgi:hypothetical protein